MRERILKFRAWWKDAKMMDEVTKLVPDSHVEILVECTDGHFERQEIDFTECVLMQYTGLDDYHGKEIYEGDIVKTGDEQGEVQYDPDQAAYIILLAPHNKKVKSGCYNLASTHPSPIKEIIGNIYESAEE